MKKTVLTGIKPTGTPHIGNYLGAIKTALELSEKNSAIYFIADYHALTTVHRGEELRDSTYSVAATWLALGLDPNQAVFYKQSDVPEIFELSWILSCFTPKGFMNRAHAYKDKVSKNIDLGEDEDAGVNMGLFGYPCLMNADILLFGAHEVPVGKDQKQHVEFARDVAIRFNHIYGDDYFVVPEAVIREETDVIPGLDGRKMSKSYQNTIELFLDTKALKKKVNKVVTNSQEVHESKDPYSCQIYKLYSFFASSEEKLNLASRYQQGGMGWGEAKNVLFEKLEEYFKESREKYRELMSNLSLIDDILKVGAEKASAIAAPRMERIRKAIGSRK
jgi:tryptophanyl-tRNA synthetase